MTSTLRYLFLMALLGFAGEALAQELKGTVLDEKKQPMVNASVTVKSGGITKGGVVTDFDG